MNRDDGRPLWERRGEVWPMSVPTSLSWADIGTILYLIHKYHVTTFIEVGVDQGGLAALLLARAIYDENFHYFGIERDGPRISSRVMCMNQECFNGTDWEVPVRIDDVFSKGSIAWVQELVAGSRGTVCILCDGGDKPKEMEVFYPLLRSGDLLLAHDFGDEIRESQVPAELERIGIEPGIQTHLVIGRKR